MAQIPTGGNGVNFGSDALAAINKAWKSDLQNETEAVLVFSKCRHRSDPSDIIPLITVIPPPNEGKSSYTSKSYYWSPHHLFDDNDPKELIKCLSCCPAVCLIRKVGYIDFSLGLVVIKQTTTKGHEPSQQTSPESNVSISRLRDDFGNRLFLLRNQMDSDKPANDDCRKIISILSNSKNYLILSLNRYWNGTVKSLVRIPSPPGYKILQFCKNGRNFRVTYSVSVEVLWQIFNDHEAPQLFSRIAKQVTTSLVLEVDRITVPIMRDMVKYFLCEVKAKPEKQNQAIILTSNVWNAIKLCQEDTSSTFDIVGHLFKLSDTLEYPIDQEMAYQLEEYKSQKTVMHQMSCAMQLPHQALVKGGKSYRKFAERLEKEVLPILATDLQQIRKNVCKQVQTVYELLAESLMEMFDKRFVSEAIVNEEQRLEAIEILTVWEELLKLLETGARPSSILTTYVEEQRMRDLHVNQFGTLKGIIPFIQKTLPRVLALEYQHDQLEKTIEKTKMSYVSCGNHSAQKIFETLGNQINKVQGTLITCNQLVFQIRNEMEIFASSLINNFEEKQVLTDLTRESLSDKLTVILTPVLTKVKGIRDHDNVYSRRFSQEMKLLFHVFWHDAIITDAETAMSNVTNFEDDLESFFEQQLTGEQLGILKDEILKDCKSPLSAVESRLSSWQNGLQALVDLDRRLKSYQYQATSFVRTVPEVTNKQLQKIIDQITHYAMEGNLKIMTDVATQPVFLVTGNYVRFSDFVERAESKKSNLQEMRIFATEKVFIDQDVYDEMGRELQITIISPVVEVLGAKREFRLCGKNGIDPPRERSSSFYPGMGQNGIPGNPGGNGGHLYLVCEKIIDSRLLEINVQGGNGGQGQRGKNGEPGRDGVDAGPADIRKGRDNCSGSTGQPGGNGCDGGIGGCPGNGGTIKVQLFTDKCEYLRKTFGEGQRGKDGSGGAGGIGGREGRGYQNKKFLFFNLEGEHTSYGPRAQSGRDGRCGGNTSGQAFPPKSRKPILLENVISEYRKFTMNQTRIHNSEFPAAKQLLEKMNLKVELSNMTPMNFATDLQNMELILGSANHTENDRVIQDYRHFQERLARYTKWWEDNEEQHTQAQEYSLVLNILSAYSTSKILVLQENGAEVLSRTRGVHVVNLHGYFEYLLEKVKRLKSGHVELNRKEVLDSYDKHIRDKCENAERFLSKVALPAVAEVQNTIVKALEDCIRELDKYQYLLKEDRIQRHQDQKTRETIENIQIVMKVLKAVEMVSFIAQSVDSPVKPAAFIVSKFVPFLYKPINKFTPESPMPRQDVRLPECVVNLAPTMREKEKRMSRQIEMIDRFLETLEAQNVIVLAIKPLLVKWKYTLEKFQLLINGYTVLNDDTSTCLVQLEHARDETVGYLEHVAIAPALSTPAVLNDLNKLLAQLALENLTVIQELRLNSVNDPKAEDYREQKIFQLQNFLSSQLIPMVDNVIGNLLPSRHGGNFKEKKWKMQTFLRDLKNTIMKFVGGLGSDTKLSSAMEKIQEALNLIIDTYDEIESREEAFNQVETMYSVSCQSVDFTGTVKDPALRSILINLGYHLTANIFRLEYDRAVKAFNQWLFPFANKFFPQQGPSLSTTDSLEMEFKSGELMDENRYSDSLKMLTTYYVEKFEELKDHLDRYRSVTLDIDEVIHTGKFTNASKKVNPPFYIWEGKDCSDEIERLLQGEEVQLRADICKAKAMDGGRRGAVKFRSVHLFLRHQKGFLSKEQKELNGLLHERYMISLTHSGISYYRVFNQGFVMRGSSQEFRHSFDKLTANAVYEKNKNSEQYLLSPYTVWGIRLINVMNGSDYAALEKFKGKVHLVLEGDGWYVDEIAAKEKGLDQSYLKNLENYYEEV